MARRNANDDSWDLLHQYLQEIARIPRLTPEREKELALRIRHDDKAALEELVKANLRFVVSYAKRFRNNHVLFLDLINEGNIGLIHAAKKYDPDKNVKFITYAVWWIRQAILHALSEQGQSFRLPPKRANLMYRLEKAMGAAMSDGNAVPTPQELATQLDVPLRDVETLLQASLDNFSLSTEIDPDSHTELEDMIEQTMMPSVEDELEEQDRRDELLRQIGELAPKERLILLLRHGLSDNVPRKIDEIAEFLLRDRSEIEATLDKATLAICESLEIDPAELAHLLLYTNSNPEASWTYWVSAGDLPDGVSPRIAAQRIPILEKLRQTASIQKQVDALPLHERVILKLRFGVLEDEEFTLRDIGELLGLSRERVRQIEARAEAKCRRRAQDRRGKGSAPFRGSSTGATGG